MFRVHKGGLTLIDTANSDGSQPVSLTQYGDLLYVLNAGSDSIAGFTINDNGTLSLLTGSVRGLSGTGTGAAQISFTPRGDALVVTEKATNRITTFLIDEDGLPCNHSLSSLNQLDRSTQDHLAGINRSLSVGNYL